MLFHFTSRSCDFATSVLFKLDFIFKLKYENYIDSFRKAFKLIFCNHCFLKAFYCISNSIIHWTWAKCKSKVALEDISYSLKAVMFVSSIHCSFHSENLIIKSIERKSQFLWFIFTKYGELIFSPSFV